MQTDIGIQKDMIIDIGRRLWQRGMVAANDGNISCRIEAGFLITRSGVSKGFLAQDDILFLDLEGRAKEHGPKPSVETGLHLRIYETCPQVAAIVHAHPPYATAFSLIDADINDCPLEELRIQLGSVPCIAYAQAGSEELAEVVALQMRHARAGLMRRHGAIAVGCNLIEALYRMEALEQAAKIAFIAKNFPQ